MDNLFTCLLQSVAGNHESWQWRQLGGGGHFPFLANPHSPAMKSFKVPLSARSMLLTSALIVHNSPVAQTVARCLSGAGAVALYSLLQCRMYEVLKWCLVSACQQQPVEFAFVIDSSSSIHPSDFRKGQNFLIDFLSGYDIGPGKVRVHFKILRESRILINFIPCLNHKGKYSIP